MKKSIDIVPRWLPALLTMTVIFVISAQPADRLPDFLSWDYIVKKSSHMIGYSLLSISYLHFLEKRDNSYGWAWLLAVLFSATDEYHQSFVAGRHSSVFDIVIFDNLGALAGLALHSAYWKRRKKNN